MATRFSQRPAVLLSVSDPYLAWCLDEVVFIFGNYFENEIEKISSNFPGREKELEREHYLKLLVAELLDQEEDPEVAITQSPTGKGKFADPAIVSL
jgi:hypothetical protein